MMKPRTVAVCAIVILSMTAVAERTLVRAQAQVSSSSSESAPSALSEIYHDWIVRCGERDNSRTCIITQQQRHRETNQLVLAADLKTAANGALTGTLVLPFGLRLSDGIQFQVDERPVSPPVPYATCLPVGCVVPLTFAKPQVAVLRSGGVMKISAVTNQDGKPVAFSVSLKGFSTSLDRLMALGG